jgi:integrase
MVELGLPPDVVQEQLGHADPRITAGCYFAQEERRAQLVEAAPKQRAS